MLARIARALDTTVPELVGERADDQRQFDEVIGLMGEPSVLEMARTFARIPRGEQRCAVLDLAQTIAGQD